MDESGCRTLVNVVAGASPSKADFAEAKDALEKSITARPNYVSSQIALGRLLLQEGRVDTAIAHLELGRQLAPQDPSCYLLLATAYRKLGQPEQARAMMAKVAKLNGNAGWPSTKTTERLLPDQRPGFRGASLAISRKGAGRLAPLASQALPSVSRFTLRLAGRLGLPRFSQPD